MNPEPKRFPWKGKTPEEQASLDDLNGMSEEEFAALQFDPVCLIHGKRYSEHQCLYCCLCFRDLRIEECAIDEEAGKPCDLCMECAAEEREMKAWVERKREAEADPENLEGAGPSPRARARDRRAIDRMTPQERFDLMFNGVMSGSGLAPPEQDPFGVEVFPPDEATDATKIVASVAPEGTSHAEGGEGSGPQGTSLPHGSNFPASVMSDPSHGEGEAADGNPGGPPHGEDAKNY